MNSSDDVIIVIIIRSANAYAHHVFNAFGCLPVVMTNVRRSVRDVTVAISDFTD